MHKIVTDLFKIAIYSSLVLALTSCGKLSISSKSWQRMQFEDHPLVTLKNREVTYLLQECTEWKDEKKKPYRGCDKLLSTLLVRPKGWELQSKAKTLIGQLPQDRGHVLGEDVHFFGRPAVGTRGNSGEFIGYFVKDWEIDFIWAHTKVTGSLTPQYDIVPLKRPTEKPFSPMLVVRDEADAWLFAERGGPCNDDLCYFISETLGIEQELLPEALRHPFMLYHASLSGPNKKFKRVLPAELAEYLEEKTDPLPRPGQLYAFDFNTIARSKIASDESKITCEIEKQKTEHAFFMGGAPIGQYSPSTNNSRLIKCSVAEIKKPPTAKANLIPEPLGSLPTYENDDPRITRDSSSYYCHRDDFSEKQQFDTGEERCYFVLHDPKTGRISPRTPYLIWLFSQPSSNDILEVNGITSDNGETAVICSKKPITIRNVRVSRRVLSPSEFSPADSLVANEIYKRLNILAAGEDVRDEIRLSEPSSDTGTYNSPRRKTGRPSGISLDRWSDMGMVYNIPYRMELCSGAFLEDITDDMGWTVFYDQKMTADCPVTYWAPR